MLNKALITNLSQEDVFGEGGIWVNKLIIVMKRVMNDSVKTNGPTTIKDNT